MKFKYKFIKTCITLNLVSCGKGKVSADDNSKKRGVDITKVRELPKETKITTLKYESEADVNPSDFKEPDINVPILQAAAENVKSSTAKAAKVNEEITKALEADQVKFEEAKESGNQEALEKAKLELINTYKKAKESAELTAKTLADTAIEITQTQEILAGKQKALKENLEILPSLIARKEELLIQQSEIDQFLKSANAKYKKSNETKEMLESKLEKIKEAIQKCLNGIPAIKEKKVMVGDKLPKKFKTHAEFLEKRISDSQAWTDFEIGTKELTEIFQIDELKYSPFYPEFIVIISSYSTLKLTLSNDEKNGKRKFGKTTMDTLQGLFKGMLDKLDPYLAKIKESVDEVYVEIQKQQARKEAIISELEFITKKQLPMEQANSKILEEIKTAEEKITEIQEAVKQLEKADSAAKETLDRLTTECKDKGIEPTTI